MENTEKETSKQQTNPSEGIETVTPDTEKLTPHTGSPQKPVEPAKQEKHEDGDKGEDDARDAIETISP